MKVELHHPAGFSLGRLHMGGFVPPHMGGGTSAGGQSVNGGDS